MKDLLVIIPYFNPLRYQSRLDNLRNICQRFDKIEQDYIVAEASQDIFVTEGSKRFKSKSILWHKERLINLTTQDALEKYDNIAWIDADIIFTNTDWKEKTLEALKSYDVAHLIGLLVYAPQNFDINAPTEFEGMFYVSDLIRRKNNPNDPSAIVGGAWAARSSWLKENNLYDKAILGGGDTLFLKALLGEQNDIDFLCEEHKKDYLSWANNLSKAEVGVADNKCIHLWHGEDENRAYKTRHKILKDNNFEPSNDLEINEDGLFEITNSKIATDVRRYFKNRNEDGISKEEFEKQETLDKIDFSCVAYPFALPKITDEFIQVGIATRPDRKESLLRTLCSIAAQDVKPNLVNVCLNDYQEIPQELKGINLNIYPFLSDMQSVGKFYSNTPNVGFRFTIDDDIIYPQDYIKKMIGAIESRERKCIVGIHGILLKECSKSYFGDRTIFPFQDWMPVDYYVHILGTGTTAWHGSLMEISDKIFPVTNNDDCQLAVLCERRKIPRVMIAHDKFWLKEIINKREQTISYASQRNPEIFNRTISSIKWEKPGFRLT